MITAGVLLGREDCRYGEEGTADVGIKISVHAVPEKLCVNIAHFDFGPHVTFQTDNI